MKKDTWLRFIAAGLKHFVHSLEGKKCGTETIACV